MREIIWIEVSQKFKNPTYGFSGGVKAFIAEIAGGVLFKTSESITFIPNAKVSDFFLK